MAILAEESDVSEAKRTAGANAGRKEANKRSREAMVTGDVTKLHSEEENEAVPEVEVVPEVEGDAGEPEVE